MNEGRIMSCHPNHFKYFLSGGAGFGKSILMTAITEYLKRLLIYPNHNLDKPCSWDCIYRKAATGINGITLHSVFHLPVNSGLKSYEHKKPSDGTLHMLRKKYQYLKVWIIDEISVMWRETFGHLYLALKTIIQNSSPFGGVSLLVVGDFL